MGMHADCDPTKKCRYNGVDDYLALGGSLEDLTVLHREAPVVSHLFDLQHITRKDKRLNCSRMLTAMAEHADDNGGFAGSIEKLGRIVDMPRRTAFKVVSDYLVGESIISVDRPLLLKRKRWVRGKGYVGAFDWEDRPTFILPAHLRAEPFRFFRLKHWHNTKKEDMDKLLFELRDQVRALRGDVAAQRAAIDTLMTRLPDNDEVAEAVELFLADALAA
jgi:hypothetical protein